MNTAVSYEGQSIGFSIPINEVRKIVDDIAQYGHIVRPWLGVRYLPVDEPLAAERGLPFDYGVLLESGDDPAIDPAVIPGSPAEIAGLRDGDVILSVNGIDLTDDVSLGSQIGEFAPGQTIVLKVARGDEMFELNATLAELSDE
ncbi:PDZ domain-containing protein [bacterium]|nr:PDZ domain-containing protein [bacterium]